MVTPERHGGRSLRPRAHLDLISHDAGFKAVDLDPRVVAPSAVGHFEAPGVPGAGDDAVVDLARPERSSHVGAEVVDGEILAVGVEDGDEPIAEDDGDPLAFRD
jgi:hypothetical protein